MIAQNQEKKVKKLESFLDETMTYHDLPGLAAGVFIGSGAAAGVDLTLTGVRGYADYAARKPLQEEAIFHCASVSKLFTASAVMKLVSDGVLQLDDLLADLLPDLPFADTRYKGIALHHMLSHTSGIGDCEDYHWNTPFFGDNALKDYVYSEEVCAQPMVWEPGTGFRYSNVAYEILGHIVSEYSALLPEQDGQKLSYEDFVAKYCLAPASMTSATMKTYERKGWKSEPAKWDPSLTLAVPHERHADRSIHPVQYYPYTRQHAPSSTLTATVDDLLMWGRAHLDDAAEGLWHHDIVWTPRATVQNNGEGIGIGWFIRKQTVENGKTYTLYGHEGSDDGFRSSFWLCPELNAVTVILSNLSNAPVKKINKKLFALIAEEA